MGDGMTDLPDKFKNVFNFLTENGDNGVLLNKILVWIEIQSSMTVGDLWIQQAKSRFLPEEIMQAKAQFFQCAKDNGNEEIAGKYIAHKKGNNPVEQNLKELAQAMKKLCDANRMPLILGSTKMMKSTPAYSIDDSNLGMCDVMERVKTLESTMGLFMESQNKKFDSLNEMVGTINQGGSSASTASGTSGGTSVRTPSVTPESSQETKTNSLPAPVRSLLDTVLPRERINSANKRKKMDDQEATESNKDDDVFEIINVSSGEKWTEVVKKDKKKHEKKEKKETERKQSTARGAWRKPLVVGTAKSDEKEHKVDVADVTLVAAGLAKEATAEQLKAFVTQQGLTVTSCSLMTDPSKNPDYRSNTFKVTIKAEEYEKAMDEKMWPYRVRVRLFKHFRKNANDIQKQQMMQMDGVKEASK